jgi:hypothetical protein
MELYRTQKYCLECKGFVLMVKIKTDEWLCKTCYTFGDGQHPLDKQHVATPTERLGKKGPGFKKSPHRTRTWATCVRSKSATIMRYRKGKTL